LTPAARRTCVAAAAAVAALLAVAAPRAHANALGWSARFELAASAASGNTDVLSVVNRNRIARADSVSTVALATAVAYGESDDAKNTQSLGATLNADYYPWRRWSVFSFADVLNNPFRDIRVRATGALGVKRTLLDGARGNLALSLAGIREFEQARSDRSETKRFLYSWRTKAELRLGPAARVTQIAFVAQDFEKPFEDYRLDTDTALTVKVERRIDLRVAYTFDYDNEPRPGVERTDRLLTTGLVLAFE
jgi:putative salt-induced outer membrane protein YdiY